MRRDFAVRKKLILASLGIVLAADVALAAYRWRLASERAAPRQEIERMNRKLGLFDADIKRAQEISLKMPAIQQDCDRFEKAFPAAGSGYSTIENELGETARKAGLRVVSLAFHEKAVAGHPLREVAIDASLEGSYAATLHFLNAVQKSESFYIVDELKTNTAAQGGPGALRLDLKLRTYLRAGP